MYDKYGIKQPSEFDFFETVAAWGYNAYLNQLCGVSSDVKYSLVQIVNMIQKVNSFSWKF